VKLDIATKPKASPIPEPFLEDASQARCSVIVATDLEATRYAILPAPRFPGQRPEYAPKGTRAGRAQIEVGVLTEDASALAARIAERVRVSRE